MSTSVRPVFDADGNVVARVGKGADLNTGYRSGWFIAWVDGDVSGPYKTRHDAYTEATLHTP